MKREYLGDSYDAVKRLWCTLLSAWAPLYANPGFIPEDEDLRQDFTRLTGIPMLPEHPPNAFSILNDPDVGIRLPGEDNQAKGRTHVRIASIVEQQKEKIEHLRALGCDGFYYVSHASFLFAARDSQTLQELRRILLEAGIPEKSRVNKAGIA